MQSKLIDLQIIQEYQSRPWNAENYFSANNSFQTMLCDEEVRLLEYIGSTYQSIGEIIDAGAFVGGSTISLAKGLLRAGKVAKIRSFDLFVAGEFEGNCELINAPGKGSSFRHIYDENISQYSAMIEVNQGDICKFDFNRPIEILFLDCLKASEVNDFIVPNLFSKLIPGKSIVIQQDYLHEYLPWIHITMELLKDYFIMLTHTEVNSVVYLCVKEIPINAYIPYYSIPRELKLKMIESATNKWTGRQKNFLIEAKTKIF